MPATPATTTNVPVDPRSGSRITWQPAPITQVCEANAARPPSRAQLRPAVRVAGQTLKAQRAAPSSCTALAAVSASLVGVTAVLSVKAASGPVVAGTVAYNAAVQLSKLTTIAALMIRGDSFVDATAEASRIHEVLDILGQLETLVVKAFGSETKLLNDLKQVKEQISTGNSRERTEAFSKLAEIFCELLFKSTSRDHKSSMTETRDTTPGKSTEKRDLQP